MSTSADTVGPETGALTREELLAATGDDAWVRWGQPDPLPEGAWAWGGVAFVPREGRRRGLWVLPFSPGLPSVRVRVALETLLASGELQRRGTERLSVPQAHAAVAHEALPLGDGGDWDWMWTQVPPPVHPTESRVVLLDDTSDAEEISAFSHRHNPRVWTSIGTGDVIRWIGVRDEAGELVAVGGAEREATGVPHLAGIVADTRRRGQGLGTAVTAHLTRWAVAEHGVCTLGMFSDNDAARSVYHRLGYRTAQAWHSRELLLGA